MMLLLLTRLWLGMIRCWLLLPPVGVPSDSSWARGWAVVRVEKRPDRRAQVRKLSCPAMDATFLRLSAP